MRTFRRSLISRRISFGNNLLRICKEALQHTGKCFRLVGMDAVAGMRNGDERSAGKILLLGEAGALLC